MKKEKAAAFSFIAAAFCYMTMNKCQESRYVFTTDYYSIFYR